MIIHNTTEEAINYSLLYNTESFLKYSDQNKFDIKSKARDYINLPSGRCKYYNTKNMKQWNVILLSPRSTTIIL